MGLEKLIRQSISCFRVIPSLAFGSLRDGYARPFGQGRYHSWEGPFGYADALDNLFWVHPQRIHPFFGGGTSTEGRPILAAKISADVRNPRPYAFLFTGMIHAREFIAGEACLHIARRLLEDYRGGDVTVRKIMDCAEVFVLPVINPDSFAKNVDSYADGRVFGWMTRHNANGVDLNRNFDDRFESRAWTNSVSFPPPFNEEYAGPHPFSEAESRAVRDFVIERKQIIAAMNFHSVSNVVLYQPGSCMDRYESQRALAHCIADEMGYDAVQLSEFLEYSAGRWATLIRHPTVEGSLDGWLYQKRGISSFLAEIGEANMPLLLLSHLASYNPPPSDISLHAEKCYQAAKRMMIDVLARME